MSDEPGSVALSLSPATISALRARHVAFLLERLVDDRARGDFIRSFTGGYEHVLAQPLAALIDPKAVVALVEQVLTDTTVRGLVSPIAREIHRRALASLRTDDAKLGDYVPTEAREAINELLARPDLVPDALIRRIFEDNATEEIMRDVLYDALTEFNKSVNPFFAEWGLPALLKRFVPIGSGAVLKSMSALRGEFDKRLEPEIRKFLLGFSRRSKTKVADMLVSSAADPKLVALRRNIAAFFYETSLAELTKNVDDDARMTLDDAVDNVVRAVLRADRPKERLVAEIERLLVDHRDETLGAWLQRIGVTERPDLEKLAELVWPWVRIALESPPARAFWERVTWDFYASLARGDAPT